MEREEVDRLEEETRVFARKVVGLHRLLRGQPELGDIARQLSRAANSVAANHRAMSRSRSTREFAAKLHIVHEEADEMAHWLDALQQSVTDPQAADLISTLIVDGVRLRNLFGRARATTRRRYFSS